MTESMKKWDLYFLGKKQHIHIIHNILHSDLCKKSTKRVLDGLKLLQQKELSKILNTTNLLLFRNNKVFKDNILDTVWVCFSLHLSDSVLSDPISFLSSAFSSLYHSDSAFLNPILFLLSAFSSLHPLDNALSCNIFSFRVRFLAFIIQIMCF